MNLLEQASKYLEKIRNKALTVDVLYNDEQVKATLGKTLFKIDSGFGVQYVESTDFLISSSALIEPPTKGDSIQFGEDEYEVLAPENEPICSFTDGYQNTYRIHTKKVS